MEAFFNTSLIIFLEKLGLLDRIIVIEEAVRYLYELRKHSFWIDEGLFEEAIRRLSE